jgi:flagellar hook-basal body complex protein FliE
MNTITQLSGTTPGPPAMPIPPTMASEGESSFKNVLIDSIQQVNTSQVNTSQVNASQVNASQVKANNAVEALFTGSNVHPAEVMTAVQKADLAFRLTLQMQNKLMDVYREIQEIQI